MGLPPLMPAGAPPPPPEPQGPPRPIEPPEPTAGNVSQLVDMGFAEVLARKALILTRDNVEAALEWILEHMDDPDATEPPTQQELQRVRAAACTHPTGGPLGGQRTGTRTGTRTDERMSPTGTDGRTDGPAGRASWMPGWLRWPRCTAWTRARPQVYGRARPVRQDVDGAINQLVDMGFDQATATAAIRRFGSFNVALQ